jgi:DNA polymerase-3 subunit delta
MDSLAFLEPVARRKVLPIYVLHGDEAFLKRQVLEALRALVFGPEGNDFGYSSHTGDSAVFSTVRNELETAPFLSARRLVVVENADPFVTKNRPLLEKYAAAPAPTGVLVLDVKSWTSTTNLAKLVPAAATISCKAPANYRLPDWCITWVASRYDKKLVDEAARLLVDLVGPEMGLLDQELAKLAIYVGAAPRIESGDVDQLVGSSRAADTFKIFAAIAEGRSAEAFAILARLFEQKQEPIALLGAISYQLRQLARAARLSQQGVPFSEALDQAGIPVFARQSCGAQLRHLGRARANQLYDWLVETDLGLKGSSPLAPRILLERLLVRLAR